MKKPVTPTFTPILDFYRPHVRSATWYTGELTNYATGEVFIPPRRVKQEFVAECDINNILKQYKLTGQIRHINEKAAQGAYEDLPDPIDFQDALNIVLAGETSFATLPAHVRDRFGNDPAQFLEFLADPANQDEAIKLGLATDTRTASSPPVPPAQGESPPEPEKQP